MGRPTHAALQAESLLKSVLDDIASILKVTKMTPSRIILYVSGDGSPKRAIYRNVLQSVLGGESSMKQVMGGLMSGPCAAYAKKMPDYVQKAIADILSDPVTIREARLIASNPNNDNGGDDSNDDSNDDNNDGNNDDDVATSSTAIHPTENPSQNPASLRPNCPGSPLPRLGPRWTCTRRATSIYTTQSPRRATHARSSLPYSSSDGRPPGENHNILPTSHPDMVKRRQILVIGHNTNGCTSQHEDAAYEVGAAIAASNSVLITGGLGGVMEAASRGASEAGGLSVGILPQDDASFANPYCDVVIPTGMGLTARLSQRAQRRRHCHRRRGLRHPV